jgi:hypothetical protein
MTMISESGDVQRMGREESRERPDAQRERGRRDQDRCALGPGPVHAPNSVGGPKAQAKLDDYAGHYAVDGDMAVWDALGPREVSGS